MKIYHWYDPLKCPKGNFGDTLNLWLWPKLIPEMINSKDQGLLIGIGTVINEGLSNFTEKIAILGSGVGYGNFLKNTDKYNIYCLRGPRTASALNVDPRLAVTDAAILIRSCYKSNHRVEENQKFPAFMPHWQTPQSPWQDACEALGIEYIAPDKSVEEILGQLANAKFVIAEAMHGAIIADAMRVPWLAVSTRPSINSFKWLDWCESLHLNYSPISLYWKRFTLHGISQQSGLAPIALSLAKFKLQWLSKSVTPSLSEESVLLKKEKLFYQKLEEFRSDWEKGVFN